MTTPPQAVPLVTGRALLALLPSAPSCIIISACSSHRNARAAWAHSCGTSPCPMPLCWLSTAGTSTPSFDEVQTLCSLSRPTSFSLATYVTNCQFVHLVAHSARLVRLCLYAHKCLTFTRGFRSDLWLCRHFEFGRACTCDVQVPRLQSSSLLQLSSSISCLALTNVPHEPSRSWS